MNFAYLILLNKHSDPSILDECGLEENTRDVLLNNIRRKLTSQAVKIRADIECACYGYEGIDAVKAALRSGLELSTEELPIKINLIAPPLYGELIIYLFTSRKTIMKFKIKFVQTYIFNTKLNEPFSKLSQSGSNYSVETPWDQVQESVLKDWTE